MKQTLDVSKQFPIVILCMAVLAILFQVIGIASSGWLVASFNLEKSGSNAEQNGENDTVGDNRSISPSAEPISRSEHDISKRMIAVKENGSLSSKENDGSENGNVKPDKNSQSILPNDNIATPDRNTSGGPKTTFVRPIQSIFRPPSSKPKPQPSQPTRPIEPRPIRPKPNLQPSNSQPARPIEPRPIRPKPNQQPSKPLTPRPIEPRPIRPKPNQQPSKPLTPRPIEPRPIRPKPNQQPSKPLTPRPIEPRPIRPKPNQQPSKPLTPRPIEPRPIRPKPNQQPSKPLTPRPIEPRPIRPKPNQQPSKPLTPRPIEPRPLRPKPNQQPSKPLPSRPDATRPIQPKPNQQPPKPLPSRPIEPTLLRPKSSLQEPKPQPSRPNTARPKPSLQEPGPLLERLDKKPTDISGKFIPDKGETDKGTVIKVKTQIKPRPYPPKTPIGNTGNIIPRGSDTENKKAEIPFQPISKPFQPRLQPNQPNKPIDIGGKSIPGDNPNSKQEGKNVPLSDRRILLRPEQTNKPFDNGENMVPKDDATKAKKPMMNRPHIQSLDLGVKHVPRAGNNNDDNNDITDGAANKRPSQSNSGNGNMAKWRQNGSNQSKNDGRKTVMSGKIRPKVLKQAVPLLKRRKNLSKGNIHIGLWTSMSCQVDSNGDEKCTQHSMRDGLVLFRSMMKKPLADDVGGVATWNDLRVETMFALCAGAVGFVGTLLTVKPFCLKGRQRVTTIIGVSGWVLSCILFLVPITRVASIVHSLKNSRMHENEAVQVEMPWAAAVSGIGACLAVVIAGFLVFFTWSDERQKWNRFEADRAIVFKNDDKPRNGNQTSSEKAETGSYDNVATA